MSLPPLPEKVVLHCQPPDHYWYGNVYGFTTLQMQWYGQKCYEQGKADAVERLKAAGHWAAVDKLNAKGVSSIHTPEFAPYDPMDDLK